MARDRHQHAPPHGRHGRSRSPTRLALPIRQDPRLDEMFFGEWQGLTKTEASARDPAHYSRWREDPTIGPPAGESPFEVVGARHRGDRRSARALRRRQRAGRVAQDGAAAAALPAAEHRRPPLPRQRRLADGRGQRARPRPPRCDRLLSRRREATYIHSRLATSSANRTPAGVSLILTSSTTSQPALTARWTSRSRPSTGSTP